MGLRDAKKYISELRKRQDDPLQWPDFLTGLPNNRAIIQKMKDIYPKLGRYAIAYVCIKDINSYLIKYGPERHAEIIQWAAAILKTTADRHYCFVGSSKSHNFVAVGRKSDIKAFVDEAGKLFDKKARTFYGKRDLDSKSVLSFVSEGKKVNLGLMKLSSSIIDSKTAVPRADILPYLEKNCSG